MAKHGYLRDVVPSVRQLNTTPSGLLHCADSHAGGPRGGEVVLTFGSPGDPMQRSATKASSQYGKAPRLFQKFQKDGQR